MSFMCPNSRVAAAAAMLCLRCADVEAAVIVMLSACMASLVEAASAADSGGDTAADASEDARPASIVGSSLGLCRMRFLTLLTWRCDTPALVRVRNFSSCCMVPGAAAALCTSLLPLARSPSEASSEGSAPLAVTTAFFSSGCAVEGFGSPAATLLGHDYYRKQAAECTAPG